MYYCRRCWTTRMVTARLFHRILAVALEVSILRLPVSQTCFYQSLYLAQSKRMAGAARLPVIMRTVVHSLSAHHLYQVTHCQITVLPYHFFGLSDERNLTCDWLNRRSVTNVVKMAQDGLFCILSSAYYVDGGRCKLSCQNSISQVCRRSTFIWNYNLIFRTFYLVPGKSIFKLKLNAVSLWNGTQVDLLVVCQTVSMSLFSFEYYKNAAVSLLM